MSDSGEAWQNSVPPRVVVSGSAASSRHSSSPAISRERAISGTHRLRRVGRVDEPAVDVAPDPLRVELAQALDRLHRPGSEAGVVAAEQEPLRRTVGEHRLERRQVAVHVVQQPQHGKDATGRLTGG